MIVFSLYLCAIVLRSLPISHVSTSNGQWSSLLFCVLETMARSLGLFRLLLVGRLLSNGCGARSWRRGIRQITGGASSGHSRETGKEWGTGTRVSIVAVNRGHPVASHPATYWWSKPDVSSSAVVRICVACSNCDVHKYCNVLMTRVVVS
jgi:hypothetical protein